MKEKNYVIESYTPAGDYIPKSRKIITAKSFADLDLSAYKLCGYSVSNKTYEHKIEIHADDSDGNQITISTDYTEEDMNWVLSDECVKYKKEVIL